MKLIIINGIPGTGKTTLAGSLSARLGVPVLAKDTIKEFLFDQLGIGDRVWSKMLGKASNDFLYNLTEIMLADGRSIMIENALRQPLRGLVCKKSSAHIDLVCLKYTAQPTLLSENGDL